MGADFSSHRLFAGAGDVARCRAAAVAELRRFFQRCGFKEVADEVQAERSVVVGPAGRWLFIGDSAGSTETADPEGFADLSVALSAHSPVVDTKMSDNAAVHFYLYRGGRLEDKFGNAAFPFYRFATPEEAAPFRGRSELWTDLLADQTQVPALRAAWVQEWQAGEILAVTARLLGWEPALVWVGYTYDDEGIPLKYNEFLRYSCLDLSGFEESHFAA
jgi:hypothetical protein